MFQFVAGDASDSNVTSNATAANHGLVDQIIDFGDTQDHIDLYAGTTPVPAHVLHGASGLTDIHAVEQYAQQVMTDSGVATDVVAITVGADTYLFFDGDGTTTTAFTTADFV